MSRHTPGETGIDRTTFFLLASATVSSTVDQRGNIGNFSEWLPTASLEIAAFSFALLFSQNNGSEYWLLPEDVCTTVNL